MATKFISYLSTSFVISTTYEKIKHTEDKYNMTKNDNIFLGQLKG